MFGQHGLHPVGAVPRYTAGVLLLPLVTLALADPTFSVERGVFTQPFVLEITPEVAGATVLVSTDGSVPSVAQAGAIDVTRTTLVRAVEIDADGLGGPVITHTYLFPSDIVLQPAMDAGVTQSAAYGEEVLRTLSTMPSVSLVSGGPLTTAKSAVSAEWIDPEGDDLQVSCAAARTGTTSLGYPKNSLRLYFNGDYGPDEVDFDFWPLDGEGPAPSRTQEALSLRSGHDSVFYLGAQGQYTRNDWMDATQLAMGHTAPHGGFAHVYENGSYIGIYHVRERFGDAFMAAYLGGSEGEYEAVNEGTVKSGSGEAWAQIMANRSDLAALEPWLRIDHYLDYMLLNYYAGNTWDWTAYHNWAGAGPSARDAGGYRFYSSDSDICIYYDYTVNALYLPGPADIFPALLASGDPEFRVALADAIHRNLEGEGPLTAERAGARYEGIADSIEEAVTAESARWGYGWWDRDGEWDTERARLLDTYFPYRTRELLFQMQSAGWYPLAAPVLSIPSGPLTVGDEVSVELPGDAEAELWYTVDGTDPRARGGEPSASARLAEDGVVVVEVAHGTVIRARQRAGELWGPVEIGEYTVVEESPLVLNEWNAVGEDEVLDVRDFEGSGSDAALGVLVGNGGPWMELVVTQPLDLRGWRLTLADLRGPAGEVTFTDDARLAALPAGTLLTVSLSMPEDARLDSAAGDWRLQLTAAPEGELTRSSGFRVSAQEWQLTAWDAAGNRRLGPVGEGVSPRRGISAREVGALLANPGAATRNGSGDYGASTRSTYAAPNAWEGGEQDLSGLRGLGVTVREEPEPVATKPEPEEASGCSSAGGSAAWTWALAALLLAACRGGATPTDTAAASPCYTDVDGDGHGDAALPVDCSVGVTVDDDCDDTDPTRSPSAPEQCNSVDDDCNGAVDDAPVDPLPFYADADGDGWGDPGTEVHACAVGAGASASPGDCDDADAAVHPGAEEGCDGVDMDCDGSGYSGLGSASACAAGSCTEILELVPTAPDGPYWLTLGTGSVAPVWCDMSTGGWMLGFNRNTASTGSQGDFGSGEEGVEAVATSPELASGSGTPALGWLDLNAQAWSELRLSAAASGARTYTSRNIPRTELRVAFGEPGYLLYGGESGYYWCGGPASYTDGGVGAVNNPVGATADCKGHGSLGSGWDFSELDQGNTGLTLCGGDGSYFLAAGWGGPWVGYGAAGGAEAIWVR